MLPIRLSTILSTILAHRTGEPRHRKVQFDTRHGERWCGSTMKPVRPAVQHGSIRSAPALGRRRVEGPLGPPAATGPSRLGGRAGGVASGLPEGQLAPGSRHGPRGGGDRLCQLPRIARRPVLPRDAAPVGDRVRTRDRVDARVGLPGRLPDRPDALPVGSGAARRRGRVLVRFHRRQGTRADPERGWPGMDRCIRCSARFGIFTDCSAASAPPAS